MPDTKQNYISSFLVGLIEGLIIPLTIWCFLTGLGKAPDLVWKYTMYAAAVTAVLLSVGGVLTRREDQSGTHDKRILKVYQGLDVADEIKRDLIKDAVKESSEWKEGWESGSVKAEPLPPLQYGLFIFLGYIAGSAIILLTGLRSTPPEWTFFVLPVLVLAIAGLLKYNMFGRPVLGGMIITAASGLAAALGAYWFALML